MASITKIRNKNGSISYRVSWRVGDSSKGIRRQEYRSFDKHEDAKAHCLTVAKDIESKRVGGVKQQTLHGYLDTWIEEHEHAF